MTRLLQHPRGLLGEKRDNFEMRRERRRPQPAGTPLTPQAAAIPPEWAEYANEPGLAAIEDELRVKIAAAGDGAPFPADWNASVALARMSWIACRGLNATTVVETGVAAGFTTSFLLAALEANGGGVLHSIDFQSADRTPEQVAQVGWLVPDRLRGQWRLNRGRSRQLLPGIVRDAAPLDVFLHDGLHTLPTMSFDLRVGGAAVKSPGAVLCDDAESNPAFANWAAKANPAYWTLVETEFAGHHFGLAVLR
jgi:hypothetical protein